MFVANQGRGYGRVVRVLRDAAGDSWRLLGEAHVPGAGNASSQLRVLAPLYGLACCRCAPGPACAASAVYYRLYLLHMPASLSLYELRLHPDASPLDLSRRPL